MSISVFIKRHPVLTFYALVFAISWGGILILILLVPGILVFLQAPQVAANLPTPWTGVAERISTYGYLLWQVVLAIVLLRAEKGPGSMRMQTA